MFKFQNQQTEQKVRRRQDVEEAQGRPQLHYMCEFLLRGSERFRRAAAALMPALFKKSSKLIVLRQRTRMRPSLSCAAISLGPEAGVAL